MYTYPLDKLEKSFKYDYEHGNQHYFDHPMKYSEFQKLDPALKEKYTSVRQHHRINSENPDDNTVFNIFQGPDDIVKIFPHARYSLPLWHNHEHIELVYQLCGKCTHFIENQKLEMVEGDLFILSPKFSHCLSVCTDDSIAVNMIVSRKLFDISFIKLMQRVPALAKFFEDIINEKSSIPYICYPTAQDNWIHKLVNHMFCERSNKGYLYNESMSLLLQQLFVHILRHYEMSAIFADPVSHKQDSQIVSLIGYITAHINDVTLDSAASFFGYNKSYLSQLLNKYTGKTFTVFVNELRMQKASKLLVETDMSITDISIETGCYDASHFNRKFYKVFHMSPRNYRNKYINVPH